LASSTGSAVTVEADAGDEDVDVWVVPEGAGPRVKNAQGADPAAEELGVPRKVLKRLKRCAHQYRVQDTLV
jgi:tartrate dehydratase alpha subunit/fumarate hydratase class I-like protein